MFMATAQVHDVVGWLLYYSPAIVLIGCGLWHLMPSILRGLVRWSRRRRRRAALRRRERRWHEWIRRGVAAADRRMPDSERRQ